jgi:hypothetical protein
MTRLLFLLFFSPILSGAQVPKPTDIDTIMSYRVNLAKGETAIYEPYHYLNGYDLQGTLPLPHQIPSDAVVTHDRKGNVLKFGGWDSWSRGIQIKSVTAKRDVVLYLNKILLKRPKPTGMPVAELSIIDFGAKPNDSTYDNHDAIQSAIDSALKRPCAIVIVPEGTWYHSSHIKVDWYHSNFSDCKCAFDPESWLIFDILTFRGRVSLIEKQFREKPRGLKPL